MQIVHYGNLSASTVLIQPVGDHDLEEMYLDSFLTIADLSESDEIERAIEKLEHISEQFQVKFVLSVSKSENDLPESIRKYISISL